MIERKLLTDNNVKVIGTLTDVEVREGSTKDGRDYISGKITIKSNDKSLQMHFFSMKLTKSGSVSKLYNTYSTLDTLRGHRVEVTGEIDESKIVEGTQLRRGNTLNAKFIKVISEVDTKADEASFTFAGFVKDNLACVYEQDGATVKDYIITLGQATYNNGMAKYIRFNVDKANSTAINGIQNNFAVGDSIKIEGSLDFNIETVTNTTQNDFGPDTVKQYQKSTRRYVINSGKKIVDEFAYTQDEINELAIAADADDKKAIADRGNTNTSVAPTATAATPRTASQPKLI